MRTSVTLGSSLRWWQYEELDLRERNPVHEEASEAGEATCPGEGDGYSTREGERNVKREQGDNQQGKRLCRDSEQNIKSLK